MNEKHEKTQSGAILQPLQESNLGNRRNLRNCRSGVIVIQIDKNAPLLLLESGCPASCRQRAEHSSEGRCRRVYAFFALPVNLRAGGYFAKPFVQ
jgi:hypothetical protein